MLTAERMKQIQQDADRRLAACRRDDAKRDGIPWRVHPDYARYLVEGPKYRMDDEGRFHREGDGFCWFPGGES